MSVIQRNLLCVFCYKPTPSVDKSRDRNEFLRLLSRYVKIQLGIPLPNQDLVSCHDCYKLGQSFRDLFCEWEALRLHLEWKVRELLNIIRAAGKVSSRVADFKRQYENDDDSAKIYSDIQKLREEVLRGCKKKLSSSLPKVTLERLEKTEETVRNADDDKHGLMECLMTFVAVFQLSLPFHSGSEASNRSQSHRKVKKYWRVEKYVQTDNNIGVEGDKDRPEVIIEQAISLGEVNPHDSQAEIPSSPEVVDVEENESVCEGPTPPINNDSDGRSLPALFYQPKGISLRNLFKCPKCAKTFSDERRANDHIREHENEAPPRGDVYEERQVEAEMTDDDDDSMEMISELEAVSATEAVSVIAEEMLPCHVCNSTFKSPVLLTFHLRSAHKLVTPFQCPRCEYQSNTGWRFRQHMRRIHNTISGLPGAFQCNICKERFSDASHLTQHAKVHQTRFKCGKCKQHFENKAKLHTHTYHIHSEEAKRQRRVKRRRTIQNSRRPSFTTINSSRKELLTIRCPICQSRSKSQESLATHVRTVHQQILTYECAHCNTAKLKTLEGFRSHMYFIHGKLFKTSNELLSAENMSYSFTGGRSGGGSTAHGMEWPSVGTEFQHDSTETVEGSSSSSPQHLPNGQEQEPGPSTSRMGAPGPCNVHKIRKSIFKCGFKGCNRCFKTPIAWVRHQMKHREDKPFKCRSEGCSQRFSSKMSLKHHCKQHIIPNPSNIDADNIQNESGDTFETAEDTAPNPPGIFLRIYNCNYEGCSESFTSHGSLKAHQGVHTKNLCRWQGCSFKFGGVEELKQHYLQEHSADRPPKENYSQQQAINDQNQDPPASAEVITLGSDPEDEDEQQARVWKCVVCQASFSIASELSSHINAEHGLEPFVKYCCHPCGIEFASSNEFVYHMFSIHEKILEVRDEEQQQWQQLQSSQTEWKYICPKEGCSVRCSSKDELMDHFKSHETPSTQSNVEGRELEMMEMEMGEENVPGEVERRDFELGSNETSEMDLQPPEPIHQQQVLNDPVAHFSAAVPTIPVPVPSPSPQLQSGMEAEGSLYFICAHCPFETEDQGELQSHLEGNNHVDEEIPEADPSSDQVPELPPPFSIFPNAMIIPATNQDLLSTVPFKCGFENCDKVFLDSSQLEAHKLEHEASVRENPRPAGWEDCILAVYNKKK